MKMPSTLMQLRVVAFSLVVIIVPFFVGYYFWVSRQTDYFNGRNLRILATMSTHVEGSVNSQSSVLQNAVQKYVRDMAAKKLCENSEPEDNDKCPKNKLVTIDKVKKQKGDYKKNFQEKALDPFKGDGAALEATNVTVVSKPADESLLSAPRFEVKEESNKHWVYFEYTVAYPSQASPPSQYVNVKARISLYQLVEPFVDKREIQENQGSLYQDGFDAVLIAGLDDRMAILFQESSAKLHMLSLNNLTTNTGGKVDLKLLGQSTNISDVRLGQVDYKLFVQPIQLSLNADANHSESLRWVACGLVEGVHFRQQTMAVSYNVLIAFGFITVLVAVSWSLLRLLFMGPKDHFRRLDAYMLGVGAFMIAALLTLAALFFYFYNASLAAGEVQLKQFAESIQGNFYSELDDALTQMDQLNAKLDEKTIAAATKPSTPNAEKITFRNSILRDPEGLITPQSSYPYLLSAFWADEKGEQKVKWTVRSTVTNRVNVSNRPFFAKLKQGRHFTYQTRDRKHDFWMEALNSPTTGARTVVISELVDKFDPKAKWVSAMELRPFSLMQPTIPEGFGFAVINDHGEVLFHSAPKLHLGEDFFEECDNDGTLQAAVLGRSKQAVTASYFGKGHSLYVAPLEHFPWTLVVFHEKDPLRTSFSEILSLCLLLFFSYVLVLCALLLASYLFKRYVLNRQSQIGLTWVWPDKGKRTLYVESMLVNGILLLFAAFAVYVMPGLWKLWLPALIVLVSIAFVVWRFKGAKSSDKPEKSGWFNYRKAYVVNLTLLVCLASIVPTYACFKIAYAEEMKLFIMQGQLSLAKAMVAREERIRNQAWSTFRNARSEFWKKPDNQQSVSKSQVQIGDASPIRRLINKRVAERRDIYDSFFFNTSQSEPTAPDKGAKAQQNLIVGFFKQFVPLFDHSSITRQALTQKAADNSWYWDDSSGDALVLHAREPQQNIAAAREPQQNNSEQLERRIQSTLPTLGSALWWGLVPQVFVFVWLLLLYMIWQLFLFKIPEPECDELLDSCLDSESPSRLLVLGPHFMGKDQLLKRMGLDQANRFDIKQVSRMSRWKDVLETKGGPVVLDNFEYGIDDKHHTQNKLELLKDLRDQHRMTIALSTIEAEGFSSANGTNGHTNGHLNGDLNGNTNGNTNGDTNGCGAITKASVSSGRWLDVFSSFLKDEPRDSGNAVSFDFELQKLKENLLERGDLDKKAIESAFALIKKECSRRAYLQNVGLAIAKWPTITRISTSTLVKQILNAAKPEYAAIWDDCTGDEKLTLTRLARYGLLSPKDPDTEKLLAKELIVRDPAIRIMNESFKLFILSMHGDDDLKECEKRAKGNSNWEALRVPLTIGLLSVAGFLLSTQRDLYNSAVPFIGGLATGLPALMKLLSLFQSGSGAKTGS